MAGSVQCGEEAVAIPERYHHRAWRVALSVLWLGVTWIGALGDASAADSLSEVARGLQTSPPQVGNRLFVDDFSTESGRWSESLSPKGTAAYQDEAFHVRIVSPGVSLWSLPDFRVERPAYIVEASVVMNHASPDAWFGVVVGYVSERDFYAFLLSGGGDWRVVRREGDDWVELTRVEAGSAGSGDGSIGPRNLAATLVEDGPDTRLILYVDCEQVGQVAVDGLPAPSGFGVMAWAGRGYVDVVFDDVGAWDVGASG